MDYTKRKKRLSTSKKIDSEKAQKYMEEHKINRSELGKAVGVSPHYIRQAIKNGYTNRVYWDAVCRKLELPEDYFDYVEPEPAPEPAKEPEAEEPKDCGVDLSDIQLSMNIFEQKLAQLLEAVVEQNVINAELKALIKEHNALDTERNNLLSEQNRMMRGKLVKEGKSNEPKGNTNGGVHGYLVGSSFPFKA